MAGIEGRVSAGLGCSVASLCTGQYGLRAANASGGSVMAAARMNRLRLQREMAARGWNACDLAQAAGLSAATLTAALQGRPVSLRPVQTIAVAIARTTAIREAIELLED